MRVLCTICTDPVQDDFCAAPCGHTFHFLCLSEWLVVKKTCPQCREKCLPRNVLKLFIDSSDLTKTGLDFLEPQEMREKLSLQDNLMAHKDQALSAARTELSSIQEEMVAWQSQHKEMHKKLKSEQTANEVMRRQLTSMHAKLDEAKENRKELETMRKKLTTLEGVERILTGSTQETEEVIASYKSISNLATFFTALKRDYEVVKGKRAALVKEKDKLVVDVSYLKRQLAIKDDRISFLRDQISVLEIDIHSAEEEKLSLQKKVKLLQAAIDSPGSRHALQRILESPMPDRSINPTAGLGASPLLISSRAQHDKPAVSISSITQRGTKRPSNEEHIALPVKMFKNDGAPLHLGSKPAISTSSVTQRGVKRPSSRENIVLPVKMFKSDRAPPHLGSSTLKPFSFNALKFAPRTSKSKRPVS